MSIRTKKSFKPSKLPRKYDVKYMGKEPKLENWEGTDYSILSNWYNYFYKTDDMWGWVKVWLKEIGFKDNINILLIQPNRKIAIMARQISNGMNMTTAIYDEMCHYLKHPNNALLKEKNLTLKKTIANYTKIKINNCISELEDIIDDVDDTFCVDKYFIKEDIKRDGKKKIWDYYLPIYNEILEIKNEADVKEAYSSWKRSDINKLMNIFKSIENCCNAEAKPKSTRIKKVTTRETQIKKLKYQKKSAEYQIKSIKTPIDIIGASVVWLFNTKSRSLALLKSSDGFKISGTTINGFDDNTSYKIKLRKPQDVLPLILNMTKKSAMRVMSKGLPNISTKKYPANGRCNNDTIILRVIK